MSACMHYQFHIGEPHLVGQRFVTKLSLPSIQIHWKTPHNGIGASVGGMELTKDYSEFWGANLQ